MENLQLNGISISRQCCEMGLRWGMVRKPEISCYSSNRATSKHFLSLSFMDLHPSIFLSVYHFNPEYKSVVSNIPQGKEMVHIMLQLNINSYEGYIAMFSKCG